MKRLLSIILALSVLFIGFCIQNPAINYSGPSLAFTADTTIPNLEDLAGVPEADDDFILWDASTSITKRVAYSYLNYLRNADEYGGLTAAVAAIGATEQTLLIKTEQTISDDLTIPSTMSLIVIKGGSMAVANTKTLTINGEVLAGDYEIFTGTGTTTINSSGWVNAKWSGGAVGALSISSMTASKPVFTDASKNLVSTGTVGTTQGGTGLTALGAANLKLFVNAAGTAAEWTNGIYTGTLTRDLAVATGTVAYTGVGFKPSAIIFFTGVAGTTVGSWGVVTPIPGLYGACINQDNAGNLHSNATVIAVYTTFSADYGTAIVSAWGADGFSLDWVKGGGATGTLTVHYMAFR